MNFVKKVLHSVLRFFPNLFTALFGKKQDKIRNKNLFKRGGYAVALIALVLIGVVVLNVLVDGVLAKRVNLEFDLTSDRKNSVSAENEAYLKSVDQDVNVYVLASSPEEYSGGYMKSWAENYFTISAKTSDYFTQTTRLLEVYGNLNDHIKVQYLDPYGTEVSALYTKYQEQFSYGDIFVTCSFTSTAGQELENYRHLTFTDIYSYSDTEGTAQMGMGYYYVDGSNLETKLTSAIASATSEQTKKVGFLAAHSNSSAFSYYRNLLALNNFTVEDITDTVLSSVSADYDALIICAPTTDYNGSELDVLNDYLQNDGHLGKALLYFGDSNHQDLPNLYEFLDEWGIGFETGIVFETNDNYHIQGSYSTFASLPNSTDSGIIKEGEASYYISNYNVPMFENSKSYAGRTTETLLTTSGTTVCMPLGSEQSTKPSEELNKRSYATCILSTESDFDNNEAVSSYVLAFSSVDFIGEDYINLSTAYKSLALRAMQIPTGMGDVSVTFDTKTIDSSSGIYITSSSAAKAMLAIFVIILPLAIIVAAFVIFFKRRNL